jgi:hypothetical protein
MSVVVALFIGLIISAEEIFRDRKILKRERYLNLSSSSYLVSKLVILFSISAVQTLTFILVGNWILEIPLTELRYWWILFSSACFANVLGLNISSAFDSAVTIYILIPILIIPQLLMSGVVVPFDKFNPRVGTPDGIPVLGEMMVSRWAFEAFMVTQFKDNPFEARFYKLDQKAANAEYKRTYHIPTLESKLSFVYSNPGKWNDKSEGSQVRKSLDLLRSEISFELRKINKPDEDRFPEIEQLSPGKFDSTVYKKTQQFLKLLKEYYSIRIRNASAEKESIIASLTDTPEKLAVFNQAKMGAQNSEVNNLVENRGSLSRIVEWKGKLVQKMYPIYFEDHRPNNPLDFTANFYNPTKHFLGREYDTLIFNIAVIWSFSILLYATLYFQVLKRIVNSFEIRRRYLWKRKE